jgi:hypothetical protein
VLDIEKKSISEGLMEFRLVRGTVERKVKAKQVRHSKDPVGRSTVTYLVTH